MQVSTRLLGIDPGSRITGFGLIDCQAQHYRYVACGCIRLNATSLGERLKQLFATLNTVIQEYQPQEASIEEVFLKNNPKTALILGHARGAALLSMANHDIPIAEYSARQVKKTVVGYGHAEKQQVQAMVTCLLDLNKPPASDAADALAIAICHAHHLHLPTRDWRFSRGRLR